MLGGFVHRIDIISEVVIRGLEYLVLDAMLHELVMLYGIICQCRIGMETKWSLFVEFAKSRAGWPAG